jgi:hypothetical protein
MKKKISILFACVGWFAVIADYILLIKLEDESIAEITVQFISYFTILTNALVAFYFSYQAIKRKQQLNFLDKPGSLTAIVVYITIVGLVYNIVLRQTWEPTGLQWILTEIFHSIVPLYVILFWYFYENKSATRWGDMPKWLIYPAVYSIFILIRGKVSGFYPYPFIDVTSLGLTQVLINMVIILTIMFALSVVFVGLGKRIDKRKYTTANK